MRIVGKSLGSLLEQSVGLGVTAEASRDAQRRAIRAGVRHVCGTDAGTPFNPHGSAARELTAMVEWGMAPLKALQAATANGADLLRLGDVGLVEPGMRADLVLYDGNPVEDIAVTLGPRTVWRGGVVVADGATSGNMA